MTQPDEVTTLEAVADRETTATNAALRGVTQEARGTFAQATATAATIRVTAGSSAAAIDAAVADSVRLSGQGYSEASRQKYAEAASIRVAAEASIIAASAQAHSLVAISEAQLKASAIPAPATSAALRTLHRSEVDVVIGAGGADVITALADLAASEDDALAGEAMSDHAIRQLVRGLEYREAAELKSAYRQLALGRRLAQGRYAATSAALAALRRAHGGIDAERVAALHKITRNQI